MPPGRTLAVGPGQRRRRRASAASPERARWAAGSPGSVDRGMGTASSSRSMTPRPQPGVQRGAPARDEAAPARRLPALADWVWAAACAAALLPVTLVELVRAATA